MSAFTNYCTSIAPCCSFHKKCRPVFCTSFYSKTKRKPAKKNTGLWFSVKLETEHGYAQTSSSTWMPRNSWKKMIIICQKYFWAAVWSVKSWIAPCLWKWVAFTLSSGLFRISFTVLLVALILLIKLCPIVKLLKWNLASGKLNFWPNGRLAQATLVRIHSISCVIWCHIVNLVVVKIRNKNTGWWIQPRASWNFNQENSSKFHLPHFQLHLNHNYLQSCMYQGLSGHNYPYTHCCKTSKLKKRSIFCFVFTNEHETAQGP